MTELEYYKAYANDRPAAIDVQKTTVYFHKNIEEVTNSYGTDEGEQTYTSYAYDEATMPLAEYNERKDEFVNYPD